MTTEQRRRRERQAGALALAVAVVALALTTIAAPAWAHTPHDDVSDVVFSPTYAKDGKVFVIAASRLFVSEPGDYHWKPITRGLPRAPEEQKSLARIAIAASNPDIMYVTSRHGGVFRSSDGGRSWRQVTNGIPLLDNTAIAVSPKDPNVVLVAGSLGGFFRSGDGGEHWTALRGFAPVPSVTFVEGSARAVAGDSTGRIWIADDDGSTWRVASPGQGAGITALSAAAGSRSATVFAGDAKGNLFRSEDGGTTFGAPTHGLPADPVNGIAPSPDFARDHTLWVSSGERGVYRSVDAGRTWTRSSQGLTTDEQAHVVHVAEFRAIVAARGPSGTVLFSAGFDGLFRSNDGGRRWHESQTLVDYVVGLDVSPDFAHDRTVAAATYVKGAYVSTDAGTAWRAIDHGLGQRPSEGNKFAPIRRLHNVTFSPDYARDHTIFSAGWTAFLRSTDRGEKWSPIRVSPGPNLSLLRQYVLGVAPGYERRHELYLGTRQGDVFRSERAGGPGSWTRVGNAGSRVRSLAFERAADGRGRIFAGTVNGVMRSDDRGATWQRTGPSGESIVAISPEFAKDATVLVGTPAGLFASRNGGGTWQSVPLAVTGEVEALAFSPSYGSDQTVLLSVTGRGLFRSTDGANSFSAIGADLLRNNLVVADFTNPSGSPIQFSPAYASDQTIFAYASQSIVRSRDRGETWSVIRLPSAERFLQTVEQATSQTTAASKISSGFSTVVALAIGLVVVVLLVCAGFGFRRNRRRNSNLHDPSSRSAAGTG